MANLDYIQVVRSISVTHEASVVSCNYSNAMNTFKGHSILISERFEYREYKNFLYLKNKWQSETSFVSDSNEIYNNSSYLKIIGLGAKSIPWILKDLKKTDRHWFYALNKITGNNPIQAEHYGVISKMKEDWIDWAKQHNYVYE